MNAERHILVAAGAADAGLREYGQFLAGLHGQAGAEPDAGDLRSAGARAAVLPALNIRTPARLRCVQFPQTQRWGRAACVAADGSTQDLLRLADDDSVDAVLLRNRATSQRVLRRLIQRGPCSVWVLPAESRPALRRILVPIDFTARSADSLRVATTLAALSGAGECLALHVYFHDSTGAGPETDGRIRAELAARYQQFSASVDTLGMAVQPLFVECSSIPRAIQRAAAEHNVDLIVMASRGRTWPGALLRPSNAVQTLKGCPAPLLVLKHFGARQGLFGVIRDPAFRKQNDLRFN